VATGPAAAPAAPATPLRADAAELMLSALTRAQDRDTLVMRVFNPAGREARGRCGLAGGIDGAFHLDLLERRIRTAELDEETAVLTVRPYGIETLELVPRSHRP
jgi:alpha-mannosidase